jgi:predicted amidophosphoribosyltransferase
MLPSQAALNKIYRAVHDGVCPMCGHDIETLSSNIFCDVCCFSTTRKELAAMRPAVAAWSEASGLRNALDCWRASR